MRGHAALRRGRCGLLPGVQVSSFDCRGLQEFIRSERATDCAPEVDMINSPPHYTGATFRGQPIEPIDVAESFDLVSNNYRATAFYYIVRAGKKGSAAEDLKKAVWWLNREIAKLDGK